ncbi:hypothetical protein BGZ82_007330 [Podila clonocystis]|nr:hypothetical protein BGZ82_007330 [Podila clonocystis]
MLLVTHQRTISVYNDHGQHANRYFITDNLFSTPCHPHPFLKNASIHVILPRAVALVPSGGHRTGNETGTYLIKNYEDLYLSIGSVPHIFPPLDAAVQLFEEGSRWVQKWLVQPGQDGGLIISDGSREPFDYKFVVNEDIVFVSTQKAANVWSVTSVRGNKVEIKAPYNDKVFTSADCCPQVTLSASPRKG